MQNDAHCGITRLFHGLLVAWILSFICCDGVIVEKGGGFVEGFVVDSLRSTPIEDALIDIIPSLIDTTFYPKDTTDENGYYIVFTGIPRTDEYLRATKAGFYQKMIVFSVGENETLHVDFKLVSKPSTYYMSMIDEVSLQEFAAQVEAYPHFDYPLVIDLASDSADSVYWGSVKLARLGWVDIDRTCTEPKCFILDTKGKLGPVEFIVFSSLEISAARIVGYFDPSGPTLDTVPIPFIAYRI
jgi:hypothetical protein